MFKNSFMGVGKIQPQAFNLLGAVLCASRLWNRGIIPIL